MLAIDCNDSTPSPLPSQGRAARGEGWPLERSAIPSPLTSILSPSKGRGAIDALPHASASENFASHPAAFQCFIIRMKRFLILHVFGALLVTMAQGATSFELAAKATNELGVDLHRQLATGDENLCISPYSIDSALAMTFAGADGETRSEMARVLHFPNGGDVPASFSALQQSLEQMSAKTANSQKNPKNSAARANRSR